MPSTETTPARLTAYAANMDIHAAEFAAKGEEATAQWARGYAEAMRHAAAYVAEAADAERCLCCHAPTPSPEDRICTGCREGR
jgi:hypothetical protein